MVLHLLSVSVYKQVVAILFLIVTESWVVELGLMTNNGDYVYAKWNFMETKCSVQQLNMDHYNEHVSLFPCF